MSKLNTNAVNKAKVDTIDLQPLTYIRDCTKMAIPELKNLVKLPVAAEWKQLGVQLGVPTHKLDEIHANHENSPNFAQECLRDMFYWWLNNGRDVTQERLERGLRDIGKTRLAKEFDQSSIGEQMHVYFQ